MSRIASPNHSEPTAIAAPSPLVALKVEEGGGSSISFAIWPLGASRVTGSGIVTPGDDRDSSTVRLQWEGLAPGSRHALGQHHGQSCSGIEALPEFVFAPVTSDSSPAARRPT